MVKLNGKALPKIQHNKNIITISGTHLNIVAINESKPLKGDLAEAYFAHLSSPQKEVAAGQLWDALQGKEVIVTIPPEDTGNG